MPFLAWMQDRERAFGKGQWPPESGLWSLLACEYWFISCDKSSVILKVLAGGYLSIGVGELIIMSTTVCNPSVGVWRPWSSLDSLPRSRNETQIHCENLFQT